MKKALLSLVLLSSAASMIAKEDEVHPCKKFARDKISMLKDAIKLSPLTVAGAEWWHVCGLAFVEFFDSLTQHEVKKHLDSNKPTSIVIKSLTDHWVQIAAALAAGYVVQQKEEDKFKVLGAALATVYAMDATALVLNEVDKMTSSAE